MKKGKFLISFLIITAAFILIVLSLAVPRTHRKREFKEKPLSDLVVIEIKQLYAAKLVQPESGVPPLKKFEVMIKVKNQGVAPVSDLGYPLKLLFYEVTAPNQLINIFLLDLMEYGALEPVLSLEPGESCYSTCEVVSGGTYVKEFSYDILTDHTFVAVVDPHFVPESYGAVQEMNEGNNLREEVIKVEELRP